MRYGYFWAAHVNHHSSQTLNLATALRQSWGEQFYKIHLVAVDALVGFNPLMMLMMMSISLIYQYWVHTEFDKNDYLRGMNLYLIPLRTTGFIMHQTFVT